jgi:hypothetical protein
MSLFLFSLGRNIWQIFRASADRRVCGPAAWNNGLPSTVDAPGGQTLAVNGLDEDARNFLRERAVFAGRTTAERFFELVRYIRTYKYTFPVCHITKLLL